MKEPLHIDCRTTKIKVISINGQLEQSKISLRANENSEQNQANRLRRKKNVSNQIESGWSLYMRLVKELTWRFFTSLGGRLEKFFSGGSRQGAEENLN